jgi:lysine 6-dehydrogenase
MEVIVLGGGRVGSAMAIDLAKDSHFNVSVADIQIDNLNWLSKQNSIRSLKKDLSDTGAIKETVKDFDLVINALPGFMGFQTFRVVIEAGKNIVDIAFFPIDPFQLDDLAKRNGVTAVMDCGVAPGMSNLLIGYVDSILESLSSVEIYVGGLPAIREWPYEYKAVFSPIDVIEEYTRPARLVESGKEVIRPALSEPELLKFPKIGTLEAFNTDGLRTLIKTIKAPFMKEKTLRYPGHIEKMAVLRETGFFDEKFINVNGCRIRPIDVTSKLLFPIWELKKGETDITVMHISIKGRKDDCNLHYQYDLFDRFDPETKTTSMARTTGYTATMVARLLADGLFDRKGVSPPEIIGRNPKCAEFILSGLRERGIHYNEAIETLS